MANNVDSDYSWSSLKPMPTKRVFSTAVGVGSELYILGGCDAKGVPLDCVESLNLTKKKQWNRLRNLPTPRAGICAVTMDSKIFTFGGVDVNQVPTKCVEIYETKTKSWTEGDTMIEKLMGVSAVVRENCVYVVGGMGEDSNPKNFLMYYNPEIDRWGRVQSGMPTPRYATFSFLIDGCLYVVGGRQGKNAVTAIERYDFKEGRWMKLKEIPSKRVFAMYTASDDHIYSVAGLNADAKKGFSDVVEVYDYRADEWMLGVPCPTKRGDFAIGFQGGKLIAAGGLGNEGKPMSAVDSFDLASDLWTQLPPMPNAHCSCAHTMVNGQLYVGGGLTTGGPSGHVEVLSHTASKAKKS